MDNEKLKQIERLEYRIDAFKMEIDNVLQNRNLTFQELQKTFGSLLSQKVDFEKNWAKIIFTGDRADNIRKNLDELETKIEQLRQRLTMEAD